MKLSTKVLIGFLILWFAFYCSPADVNAEEVYTTEVYSDGDIHGGIKYYPLVYTLNATSEIVGYVDNNRLYISTVKSLNGAADKFTGSVSGNGNILNQSANYNIPTSFIFDWSSGKLSAQCKIFDSQESAKAYCQTGSVSGLLNGTIENGGVSAIFDENIEMPEIVVDDAFEYVEFNNACEDYNIEMQGRWWTIDDMEMYKEDNYWHLKYSSTICNELSTWVEISEKINSIGSHPIFEYGDSSFNDLLEKYPIDERTFTGGTNAVGNFLSGYTTAKEQYKDLLQYRIKDTALYIQPEIYVRYWYIDDNNVVHYGRWCHAYKDLYKSGYSTSPKEPTDANGYIKISDKGLTDIEKDTLESSGDSTADLDFNRYQPKDEYKEKYDANMEWFGSYTESFANSIGNVPNLFSKVFGFLPKELVYTIAMAIGVCVILRVLGR